MIPGPWCRQTWGSLRSWDYRLTGVRILYLEHDDLNRSPPALLVRIRSRRKRMSLRPMTVGPVVLRRRREDRCGAWVGV